MATPTVKRIVCLAKSYIKDGRCIAGKELLPDGSSGAWLRLVSSPENGGVSYQYLRYADRTTAQVLDVADVSVLSPLPKDYQQENWLLDTTYTWGKVRRWDWNELDGIVDPIAPLWINGYNEPHRANDLVPLSESGTLGDSLRLVKVGRLDLIVSDYGGRRRVDGQFRYDGTDYCFPVTDPAYDDQYRRKSDGAYSIYGCYLCVSLALPGPGSPNAYKLIATIFDPDTELA